MSEAKQSDGQKIHWTKSKHIKITMYVLIVVFAMGSILFIIHEALSIFNPPPYEYNEPNISLNLEPPIPDYTTWRGNNATVCAHLDYMTLNNTKLQIFNAQISARSNIEAEGIRVMQINSSYNKYLGSDDDFVYCGLRMDVCFSPNLCSDAFLLVFPVNLTEYEQFIEYVVQHQNKTVEG